jgi:hypothetical protein
LKKAFPLVHTSFYFCSKKSAFAATEEVIIEEVLLDALISAVEDAELRRLFYNRLI